MFSKGFGLPKQDEVDDSNEDMTKNASGTGMGEGAGTKDVSDQIEDEDQLLGDSKQVKTAILNPLIHFRVLEMQKKKHKHSRKNHFGIYTAVVYLLHLICFYAFDRRMRKKMPRAKSQIRMKKG